MLKRSTLLVRWDFERGIYAEIGNLYARQGHDVRDF